MRRFLGIELARRVEDFLGEGRPDHIDQLLEPGIGIAESELRRGNGEARIVGADTQVAAQRQADAAADAIAADHRDGRLGIIVDRRIGALDRLVVAGDGFLVGALVLEFRNVGAGHEGLAAGAGDHHDAHLVVLAEILQDLRRRLPHFQRDGVVALGIVEDQIADAALLAREHLVHLRHLVSSSSGHAGIAL